MGFVPRYLEVRANGGSPSRLALVAHGILGSGSNWRSFIRRLVDTDPKAAELRWILVDLRHHGDSLGAPPPHTVEACAADLAALERELGAPFELTVGHSFGGKVVLAHAGLAPRHAPSPRAVWFLDTPVGAEAGGARAAAGSEIGRVLAVLRSLPEPLPGRAELVLRLREAGLSEGLAQWMTTNVRGTADEGYRWRFDLDACEQLVVDYFGRDLWPLVEDLAGTRLVRCVRGGRSDRFTSADIERLEATPGLRVHVLERAGHWLHVDDPDGLRALFSAALRELE